MGSRAKATETLSKHLTIAEIADRTESEEKLKSAAALEPMSHLSGVQKELFWALVEFLEGSGLLAGQDTFLLSKAAIDIDMLRQIDEMINAKPDRITDTKLMSARDKYAKGFEKACQELCLSPAARAKLSSAMMGKNKDEDDPLLKALGGEGS